MKNTMNSKIKYCQIGLIICCICAKFIIINFSLLMFLIKCLLFPKKNLMDFIIYSLIIYFINAAF